MGFFKKVKKALKKVERVATGRGSAGKWNIFAAPERYLVRPVRHGVGFSRSSLIPRGSNSASSISYGGSVGHTGYVGDTGFRRFV